MAASYDETLETEDSTLPTKSSCQTRPSQLCLTTQSIKSATSASGMRLTRALTLKRPSLLRGTKSAVVLARAGALLADSAGNDETYRLSAEVKRLNTFISHNWVTGRVPKFMVLALFFNFSATVCAMVASTAVTFTLLVTRVVVSGHYVDAEGHVWTASTHCSIVGSVCAFLVLFLWHEVAANVASLGHDVFLDKTCIHQADAKQMREGIESLGAFVHQSEWFLVVYSDVYLQKLWTVYELATYLCFHPARQLVLIPVRFPAIFLVVHLMVSVYCIFEKHAQSMLPDETTLLLRLPIRFAIGWLICCIGCIVLRIWHKSRESIQAQVSAFNIRSASCYAERDRVQIEQNVADMMRSLSAVPEDASMDEALDAFDALIHSRLPPIIYDRFNAICSYKYCVFMSSGTILRGCDALAALVLEGQSLRDISIWLTHYMASCVLVVPLLLAFLSGTTSKKLKLRGILNVLYVALLSTFGTFMTYASWFLHYRLCTRAQTGYSVTSVALLAAYTLFLVAVVVVTFVPRKWPQQLLDTAAASGLRPAKRPLKNPQVKRLSQRSCSARSISSHGSRSSRCCSSCISTEFTDGSEVPHEHHATDESPPATAPQQPWEEAPCVAPSGDFKLHTVEAESPPHGADGALQDGPDDGGRPSERLSQTCAASQPWSEQGPVEAHRRGWIAV